MSALTGNQIKNSYQGLLKLANSSTGITQNLQAVEDGLGNETGVKFAINQFEAPNIISFINLKGRYFGNGFQSVSAQQLANGTQNVIIATPFYDKGLYSYSAMSYNVISATSTSDSVEVSFYTAQMLPEGLYPHAVISSGYTLTGLTSPGVKDYVFPSNISFSGYGGGIFFIVYKISNSGVQPTIRFGGGSASAVAQANNILGYAKQPGVNQYTSPIPVNQSIGAIVLSGTTNFANPFPTTLPSTQNTTSSINGSNLGFILHTTNF